MIFAQQKLKLLRVSCQTLTLIVFSPVRQPSTIDLSAQQHSLGLYFPCIVVLLLCNAVIDADVGPVPVAFLDVVDCIHIVLVGLDA